MNLSLVFCSLPLCHFLILSFQVVCFWEKILQHDFPCCLSMLPLKFQGTWMFLPAIPFSRNRHLRKTQTEFQYFVHLLELFCISLPINAKKNLLQHLFLAKHTYLVELHLELNSGSSLHLYRSLSLFYTRCAPFRVWRCSQALLPPYRIAAHHFLSFRVPAKKSGGTNAIYGSACLALFTASLTKKWGVWSCALSKWQCLHNETGVTSSIYEFKQKQLLHLKSRRTHPRRHPINAHFLMEHRGACAGCRSVESHLFMEGGLVCEWQVATSSCSEGSPSAKHVRTHSRVDMNFAGSSQKLNEAVLNKLLTFWIGDIWQESPLPYPRMIIFDILARHGFAGPVLSLRNETCLVQVESRVLTYLAHMYWKDWIYIY